MWSFHLSNSFWLSFNRTIVELKRKSYGVRLRLAVTFNRTIVELKHTPGQVFYFSGEAFNRTIVELKHGITSSTATSTRLLIEPLWN